MKNFFLFFILMFAATQLFAVPANPKPIEKTLPDGTVITVRVKGDERVHWLESMDGYTLMYNNKREIVFAEKDKKGNLVPSKIPYRGQDLSKYSRSQRRRIEKTPKKLFYSKEQINTLKQIRKMTDEIEPQDESDTYMRRSSQKASTPTITPVLGEKKVLCILAQFSDIKFVKTTTDFEALMNQVGYTAGGNKGSVKDFYRENSYGKMDITVTVVGPVTCSGKEKSYVDNEQAWAKEVATLANSLVDYSQFAVDGYVPSFHIIFAGHGAETGLDEDDYIWSHKWNFSSSLTADGVKIGRSYSCSPELGGSDGTSLTKIGVICHELCHTFGAPDYYDTDYDEETLQYSAMGAWDLMAGGSWNGGGACPAHINGWQKILFGWITPIELTVASTVTNMPAVCDSAKAYWISVNSNGERYILENRQQTKFDSYIPGHGLLIYHIHQDALGGDCDNTTHPQQVYPVCASATTAIPNSTPDSYGTINGSGCPFPGTSNKKSFSGTTTPRMFTWQSNAAITGKPITNITESASKISFDFMGGGTPPTPPEPCKDSITIFPFSWSFEDVQPCYDFSAVEADPGKNITGAFSGNVTGGSTAYDINPHTGNFAYIFSSYYKADNYNQYMISPRIVAPAENALKIELWYKNLSSNSSESFKVGYSLTDNNTSNFIWTADVTDASTSWKLYTLTVPAGTKYIAINYYSNFKYFLAIDDITIDTVASGGGEEPQPSGDIYTLVTSAAQLVAGSRYIIASVKNNVWYGMGYQADNNRPAVELGVTQSSVPQTVGAEAATVSTDRTRVYNITLEGTYGAWKLKDAVNNAYLKPRDGKNNGLQTTTANIPTWTVVPSGSVTAITCVTQTNTDGRNLLKFNTGSESVFFGCYKSSSGGVDSVYLYKYNDTVFSAPLDTTKIQANICYGEIYTKNGFNVSEAGIHYLILQNLNGADSTVLELNLAVSSEPVVSVIDTTICNGSAFIYSGAVHTESTVIKDTLHGGISGCDSVYL
ncbi:MAG: M6 family metalloprotease domain-containing protein, partial [Bacteroidales bacterium]|nr:M6 family metalloprotease domain-containing protein [Bacteroidales bacterium]